jgi:peptidoglycan/LPS O-acetylase OafA/YrhL
MSAATEPRLPLPAEQAAAKPGIGATSSPRISALDGWRGIAILLVLFDHTQDSLLHRYLRPWTQTGQHGVLIFFVLSGYLITSNLLKSSIDLKSFYIRRFFRLMPAAWTFLATLLLLDFFFGARLTHRGDIAACLLFFRNYYPQTQANVDGHFWSLSIEEQFYLIWPTILLLTGFRWSRWLAAAGILGCAAYRWIFWAHYSTGTISWYTQFHVDALLSGCLVALLLNQPRNRPWLTRWSRLLALPAFVVLLYCIARVSGMSLLVESPAVALLIVGPVLYPQSVPARLLSFRPLALLGVISYSVYLWQELFMGFHSIIACCFILPVAICSYLLIERPLTRFGHGITRKNETENVLSVPQVDPAHLVSPL